MLLIGHFLPDFRSSKGKITVDDIKKATVLICSGSDTNFDKMRLIYRYT
jgi:hypothetical protein